MVTVDSNESFSVRITCERWSDKDDIQRWKVVLNRNGIVETEAAS